MQLKFKDFKMDPRRIFSFMENNKPGFANFTVKQIRDGKRFQSVMETEVGQGILADALTFMESLENKILDKKASDNEHMKYLAYREIVSEWARRIELYNKSIENMFKEKKNAR